MSFSQTSAGVALSLERKVALVTGGSRGIGAATVRLLRKAGARVVFSYRSAAEQARTLVAECGGKSRRLWGRRLRGRRPRSQKRDLGHPNPVARPHLLTKSLSSELAPQGILCNCVAPGWVRTEMSAGTLSDPIASKRALSLIPLGRAAEPEEIAGPIVFLCTPWAGFIAGEVCNVNGGAVLVG